MARRAVQPPRRTAAVLRGPAGSAPVLAQNPPPVGTPIATPTDAVAPVAPSDDRPAPTDAPALPPAMPLRPVGEGAPAPAAPRGRPAQGQGFPGLDLFEDVLPPPPAARPDGNPP